MAINQADLVKLCVAALLVPAMSGCASTRELGGDPNLVVLRDLPAPTVADYARQERPYIIGPYDRLVVDVFGLDGLANRDAQVDADGILSFPLVGLVRLAGRTPREAEQIIADALRDAYVLKPQVTVAVKETGNRLVTVDGRINSPGLYPVVGRMTLMQVIARSGGVTDLANLERVVVFREVGGQRLAALYDLAAIRNGAYADPEIYANDIVLVDDDRSQLLFRNFSTLLTQTALPIILIVDRFTR